MGLIGHIALALALQAAFGLWRRDWATGAWLAVALLIGREQAQAEYRWMEAHGVHRDGVSELLGAFTPAAWHWGAVLDVLLPALACGAVWWWMTRRRRP